MKLFKPELTSSDYQIPLPIAAFKTLTYLCDNDIVDLYKDHGTDIEVTEMNGHFGSNVYISVALLYEDQLTTFAKWLKKVSTPTKEFIQGLKDGEAGIVRQMGDGKWCEEEEEYRKYRFYNDGYTLGRIHGYNKCVNETWY